MEHRRSVKGNRYFCRKKSTRSPFALHRTALSPIKERICGSKNEERYIKTNFDLDEYVPLLPNDFCALDSDDAEQKQVPDLARHFPHFLRQILCAFAWGAVPAVPLLQLEEFNVNGEFLLVGLRTTFKVKFHLFLFLLRVCARMLYRRTPLQKIHSLMFTMVNDHNTSEPSCK